MSGDLLQASTWHDDGSWSSSAKPVVNDAAIVSDVLGDTVTVIDTGGTADGIDLDILQTHPTFNGSFGSSGAPIRSAADLIQVYGGGGFYFECSSGGTGLTTDRIEIAAASPRTPVEIGSKTGELGDWIDLYALRGKILIKGNTAFDAAARLVVGQLEGERDVALTLADGTDPLPTLDMKAGSVTIQRTVTNWRQSGGVAIKEDKPATNIDLFGGLLFYDHQAIGGDGTTIRVHRGATLHLWHNALQKTISNLILMPGSIIVASEHAKVHTFTNTPIDLGARWIRSEMQARQIAQRALAA